MRNYLLGFCGVLMMAVLLSVSAQAKNKMGRGADTESLACKKTDYQSNHLSVYECLLANFLIFYMICRLFLIRSRHKKLNQQCENKRNCAQPRYHIVLGGKLVALIHDDIAKKYCNRGNNS